MNDELWVKLATEVDRLLARPDVDGVTITHGTDTMEETACFLNLVLMSDKPVVMTGSMRPATSLSADGPLNIYNAVGVASDARAKGRGVFVVAHDDIHGARAVMKHHTTDVQPSSRPKSGSSAPVRRPGLRAIPVPGAHDVHAVHRHRRPDASRVDVIYAHAGMSPDLIDAAVANGAKGLVIAGVGDGNMTTPAPEAVKLAIGKGVMVVRSTAAGHRPPQHRGRRRRDPQRGVEGAQSHQGTGAGQAGAHADFRFEQDSGVLRHLLMAGPGSDLAPERHRPRSSQTR